MKIINRKNKKLIALDIGNVCVSLRYDKCFSALKQSPDIKVPESFLKTITLLETGKIGVQQWLDEFTDLTKGEFSKKELIAAYNQILGAEIETTTEFVRQAVSRGFRVVFFSNISEVHAVEIYEKLSFAHLITGAVFSYEVGYMKPAPQIYEKFTELYGVPVLFIDDKEANRNAAEQFNWRTEETAPASEDFF